MGLGTGIHVAPRAPWQPGQGPFPQGLGLCLPVPEQEVLHLAFGALMDQLGRTGAGHGYLAKLETCTAQSTLPPTVWLCIFPRLRLIRPLWKRRKTPLSWPVPHSRSRGEDCPPEAALRSGPCPRPAEGWGLTVPTPEWPSQEPATGQLAEATWTLASTLSPPCPRLLQHLHKTSLAQQEALATET